MNQPKRIEIGKPSQIPLRGSRTVSTDEGDIAIFRTAEETFFAVKDSCPHRQGPLSQGIVHGNRVTCPLHNWVIDLESGEATGPDKGCTPTYQIELEGDLLYLTQ
ncbi:MAG: nitrite reductase small subunit NirD [Gammaproteobacteria bacterium]|jgi:nitrite reductase (NADH) small subunit|nr:nitrite reductase small subunit NirD [Gammaproteobacteria bacterium]MBT3488467.1 nitrite reductase small subunit NirD [Gammaproteobacteria bacterium]MBT3719873.1 nitrite reductase small subunit NirD [Gammaproteobacteria bacterium]MBT3846162.1 nitrite reductase small subunit NirD [Gammaproteobacteria bacterium]MBT3893180.1 nitrite reductase small subunit NirD [Gammaproteobacteria bacterium]